MEPTDPINPVNGAAHIVLDNVSMSFNGRRVFDSLSCEFPRGKISVVLGGSGVGKSTVLRLIGGLVRPCSGRILVDGDNVCELPDRKLYSVRDKLGMMFQGGALLDSLNVFDNLAFPLRESSKLDEEEIREEVHRRLRSVGLSDVDELLPGELSGGMVKRVALARAIMRSPEILMIDEPFSGLDPVSTKMIEALLLRLNRELGITMVVVSHHVRSTLRMADWIVLMLPDGAVAGTPGDLLNSQDPCVTRFLNEDPDEALAALENPDAATEYSR